MLYQISRHQMYYAMKTLPLCLRNIVLSSSAVLFLIFFFGAARFNSAIAINITGPTSVCPGKTVDYTFGSFPSNMTRWRYCVVEPSTPLSWSSWQYTSTETVSYPFGTNQGLGEVKVEAFQNFSKIGDESLPIIIRVPTPVTPNNGIVLGCSANQEVSISSSPYLQNNPADCYFHCAYRWDAPSGWNLGKAGASLSNPMNFAEFVKFPAGLSNGNVGTLTVTALHSECSGFPDTYSSATLWYGAPIVSYPNQWLFDSYSNMWQLSHTSYYGFTSSYTVYSGSASLTPNGNDCYVTTSDGAVIKLVVSNSCGSSSPYYFTIPAQGSMMKAYPNPAKQNITLEFKNTESQEQLPETIKLFSEQSGKAVESISVVDYYNRKAFKDGNKIEMSAANLPRGTYYLHVYPNPKSKSELQKIRMVLE